MADAVKADAPKIDEAERLRPQGWPDEVTGEDIVQASAEVCGHSHLAGYKDRKALYEQSVADPRAFWSGVAKEFTWKTPFTKVLDYNFDMREGPVSVKWFEDGTTNLCYNCLDRHIEAGHGGDTCFFWEGNDPSEDSKMTYQEVFEETCRLANVLKSFGVVKGTKVTLYLPMLSQLPIAALAIVRVGAVLNVVFAGFSASSLSSRMVDCQSDIILTCDSVMRGGKPIHLKAVVDDAVKLCADAGLVVKTCIVYDRLGMKNCKMVEGRDHLYQTLVSAASADCPVEWVGAEDTSFLLYTSGSTGKPKGMQHTTAGYMVYAATTFKYSFDYKPGDVYWCTADVGWITGHTYIVFGPMLNRCTQVIFEGVPTYPDAGRCWEITAKYKVNQFYTAPTAIRALLKSGDSFVLKHDRSSLRVLGTVGEPINEEAWHWYYKVIGEGRCTINDTWWQTETGGHMVAGYPSSPMKPSYAGHPCVGVLPAILGDDGVEKNGECDGGYLCIKFPWPGMARSIYNDHARYEEVYFSAYKGFYFTGDGAMRNKDAYIRLTGRVDDVLNVSGHRLGTAEIESAINTHADVAESAVVPQPHEIKGEGIYCYVILKEGRDGRMVDGEKDKLIAEIKTQVRAVIGAIAMPDKIHLCNGLPKTRSGKIMRRILRKIAEGAFDALGETSTLADPSVVDHLIETRPN